MGLDICLPLIPWPHLGSGSACAPSVSGVFSFFLEEGLECFSDKISLYRHEIFYAGIGLSALAILAALSTKIACMILFMAGAALCFALAAWAFRTRDGKLSEEAGLFEARLQRVTQKGEDCVTQGREQYLLLQNGFDELSELNRQKDGKIIVLHQEVERITQILTARDVELEKLRNQNRRLLLIEQKVHKLL